jgi:casein kinase II subunit beta
MSEENSSMSPSEGDYPLNDEEEEEASSSESGWVQWFCALEGHEFLAEVSEDFLRDSSNLYGLKSKIPNYAEALAQILSGCAPNERDLHDEQFLELYQSCTDLYGLVHARFIQTPGGLAIMREKYLAGRFGSCSRVLCERHNVMPVGMANEIRTSRVKVYCPRCQDVYYPKDRNGEMDGAYFGTSFPHILLQNYPDLYPLQEHHPYVPKIAGFKVHQGRGSFAEKIETKYRTEIFN